MTEQQLATTYKPRTIGSPIATNGDKNLIPDTSSDTGVVNVDRGIPKKYSTTLAGGGKNMSRRDMNGLFNLVSQPEYFRQYMGRTLWDATIAPNGYPKGSKVWYYDSSGNGAEYVSKVDDNRSTPGLSTNWIKTGNSEGNIVDDSSIRSVVDPKLANYMSLSGTQTVTGAKIFNVSPNVPTIDSGSLSETGTRAVNEATLLSAIGSYSSSGMFIDPTKESVEIGNTRASATQVVGSSVAVLFELPLESVATSWDLCFSAVQPSSMTSYQILAHGHVLTDTAYTGPYYVKSGYLWVELYNTSVSYRPTWKLFRTT